MSSPLFILCPGQGAQMVGMGKDFHEASSAAKSIFDRANALLGFDLAAVCFNGPEERLNQTDISQPAIYVCGVAAYAAGVEAGTIDAAAISGLAGLSLGEYTALHLGGSFDFETGLDLVAKRGRAMQQAAIDTPSGMVSIVGADEATVTKLCDECANSEVLVPANFNAPGQIVVSGAIGACERVAAAAEAAGLRAIPLKLAGAFHSPLMQRGADTMARELGKATIRPPVKTVYANVTAQPHNKGDGDSDVSSIRRLLVDQIVKPVRWEQIMQQLAAIPDAKFIELPPGRVLTGLAKKINRRLPIENLAPAAAQAN